MARVEPVLSPPDADVAPVAPRRGPAPLQGGPLAFWRFARSHGMLHWRYLPLVARWAWLKLRWRGRLKTDGLAFVCPGVHFEIGKDAVVHLGRWSWLGHGCKVRCHEGEIHIGAKSVLGQECTISCYQHVSIGRECIIADRVMFIDFDHGMPEVDEHNAVGDDALTANRHVLVAADRALLAQDGLGADVDLALVAAHLAAVAEPRPATEVDGRALADLEVHAGAHEGQAVGLQPSAPAQLEPQPARDERHVAPVQHRVAAREAEEAQRPARQRLGPPAEGDDGRVDLGGRQHGLHRRHGGTRGLLPALGAERPDRGSPGRPAIIRTA